MGRREGEGSFFDLWTVDKSCQKIKCLKSDQLVFSIGEIRYEIFVKTGKTLIVNYSIKKHRNTLRLNLKTFGSNRIGQLVKL